MALKFGFSRKDLDELLQMRDIASDVTESDFIPYACHFNHDTLLTKNGELMQTIKIVGFTFESVESEGVDLRQTIRKAIQVGLQSDKFAVWFHTIRRRKNLNPGGEYDEPFAAYVHESWVRRHDWEHKFINELFITIVIDGQSGSINTPQTFMRGLMHSKDMRDRERYLHESFGELQAATGRILEVLETYGARKLGVFEQGGTYYSEPLRFLGKILKLREEEVPLLDNDLAVVLATHEVTFGFDAMEVRNPEGGRRFGAMLTVKEYRELSLASIDELLQLPEEFIISQCMDFINHKKAYEEFKRQHQFLLISEDTELAEVSGLQEIVDNNHGNATDYGEHQMTVFLVADDVKHLARYIDRTIQTMNSLGIVVMREDLRLEDCYWAQLPGNFPFLKRLKPISAARIGGLANLFNYPAGKAKDNYWGPAVTIFNTAAETPYFFNFHNGPVGHTSIIGPYGAGKTVLMNFLISEARKFNNKLFFFDENHGAEIFIRALGGEYHTIHPKKPEIAMNPLALADSPATRDFLLLWVEALLYGAGIYPINDTQEQLIESAIAYTLSQPPELRTIRTLAHAISQHDAELGRGMSIWHSGGSHSGFFDHVQDTVDVKHLICGFEMGDVVSDMRGVSSTLLYLLHRIMAELDGSPGIIVLDEAWALMDNPIFGPRMHEWLEALTRKNVLAIFATESANDASDSALSRAVFEDIATQIYLPNPEPSEAYKSVFGLNDVEYSFLQYMDADERQFLLKKGGDTIVAKLSLDGMDGVMAILSSTPLGLEAMHQLIAERGPSPTEWVPLFIEKFES